DKITAIYCRIDYPGSPEHIHIQRERALAYAEQNHLENPAVFIDDGFVGTTLDRPRLQSMVREIRAGRVILRCDDAAVDGLLELLLPACAAFSLCVFLVVHALAL